MITPTKTVCYVILSCGGRYKVRRAYNKGLGCIGYPFFVHYEDTDRIIVREELI